MSDRDLPGIQPEGGNPGNAGKWGCALLLLAPVLIVLVLFICGPMIWGSEKGAPTGEMVQACEDQVSASLKSPSTAKFDSEVLKTGDEYVVHGFVDAENSFGAMLRMEYRCAIGVSGTEVAANVTMLE